MEQMLAFYRQQSTITNPGPYASFLWSLPNDVAQLIEILGGIFAHFERDVRDADFHLPTDRMPEVDFRFVQKILARITDLDPRSLEQARPLPKRFMGTCRDAGVLLCSMLRTLGISARVRYGFTPYLMKKGNTLADHVLVEYWSPTEQQWKYCDGRLYRSLREKHDIQDIDPTNISAENFVTGAQAWLMSQQNTKAAFKLSGFKFDVTYGMWKARNLFMYDLASLSGTEPLMWDAWGYILQSKPEVRPRGFFQFRHLNQLARLDPCDLGQWRELLELCRKRRHIRVPEKVKACSPLNGNHIVTLGSLETLFHAIN